MHRLIGKGIVVSMVVSLLLLAVTSEAQVYRKVLEDGTVVYTDQAEDGAEKVIVDTVTSDFVSANSRPLLNDPLAPQGDETENNASISIVTPSNEATIWDNEGNLTVSWAKNVNRADESLSYQLYFDGQMAYQGTSDGVNLQGLDRGEHTMHVRMYDGEGNELARSDTIVIYLKQASVFNPALNNSGG